jgi:hypothetical protein
MPVECFARSIDKVLGPTYGGIDATAGMIMFSDGSVYVRIRGRPPCARERCSAALLRLITVGDRTALCLEIGLPRGSR